MDAVLTTHLPNEALVEELHWLQRCRQGDEAALAMVIARHRARIIRTAANILRDRHEAEDVAQESFLKAFRELHRLRDDRAFSGYLYRICVRLCMDRLRSRRIEPAEFDSVEESQGARVENRLVIQKLLGQMPPDLRATLVLREIEQFSYEEIAEMMHVPLGTVRSRLHTARERFRKLWIDATRETA
ncbi:MAG TPA: sigma-70 family RNA polymerase sigma factor [Fimbriimonadaceae bacterium]|nr:sigma-70 family RNA polymerase sigma factor [Fimbriimonadaceae bacterium]HRJ95255.1 sigma-70 family RNA polymerase sigma factor [Fimbriimonadaceae bacterium]